MIWFFFHYRNLSTPLADWILINYKRGNQIFPIDFFGKASNTDTICYSTYWKVSVVVRRLNFELLSAKSMFLKNMVPRLILKFHIFCNLQCLLTISLEGFDIKAAFSCKKGLLNCYCMPILCPDSTTLRAFSQKNQLFTNPLWRHQWYYHYLENTMSDFKKNLHRHQAERAAI